MKFTLGWLKDHLDTGATLAEITAKLTSIGLEVESVRDPAQSLTPFIIAKIVSAEKHPNADRLKVCVVDNGKEKLNVVCGAPNARSGLVGVFAPVGTYIPGSAITLKKSAIRGAESNGMMCSEAELQLPETVDGIIELPADAPLGKSYAAYADLDPVIEIKLTPNRPDCAGVRGIARDLAAAGLGTLKEKNVAPVAGTFKSPITVTLDFPAADKNACPHFVGRVIRNVKNGPSPAWFQSILRAIGLRPISALVDITNYISYGAARPLHVFDARKIKGNLSVRYATPGTEMAALNDKTYALPDKAIVIADDSGALALGGIMGGSTTGCSADTVDVFLESAYFDPAHIARTGRQLQIVSDARYRFERGVDPAFTQPGAELATRLIMEFCGTPQTEVSALVIAGAALTTTREYGLRPERCKTLVGLDVPVAEQKRILTGLGFVLREADGKIYAVVPSWRPDIQGEADLVEEIVRIVGFDKIPVAPLLRTAAVAGGALAPQQRRGGIARRALAAQGLLECVTWSFMPSTLAAMFAPVDENLRLRNPISSELDMMRPSTLGNLMLAAKRNADHGYPDIGVFEVGPVYLGSGSGDQKHCAAVIRAGHAPRHWGKEGSGRPVDAFDAKADALAVLAACGVNVGALQITTDAPGYYHPGRSGVLRQGPNVLASFGEMHPRLLTTIDGAQPMAGCEVWLDNIPLPKSAGTARPALALAALQPLARDFAFVVDATVTADKIGKCIRQVDKNLITDVAVFDVYAGANLGAGKKSLALSVTLQPREATLTDAQLDQLSQAIITAVAKATGGVLRG